MGAPARTEPATPPRLCAACPHEAVSLLMVSVDHYSVATIYLCERHARAARGGGWSIDLESEQGSGEWINAARG